MRFLCTKTCQFNGALAHTGDVVEADSSPGKHFQELAEPAKPKKKKVKKSTKRTIKKKVTKKAK